MALTKEEFSAINGWMAIQENMNDTQGNINVIVYERLNKLEDLVIELERQIAARTVQSHAAAVTVEAGASLVGVSLDRIG